MGAGTGTVCFGWKGGIGTASRQTFISGNRYTVGVLVQTNFGGTLTMGGVLVGPLLGKPPESSGDGSCMIIVATDAPLTSRDLKRLAARAVFGLARTGSSYSNGSGDYAVAFSNAPSIRIKTNAQLIRYEVLSTDQLSPLFEMVLEAVEEAVYNSLLQATTMRTKFGTVEAIPIDRLQTILQQHGVRPKA